MSDSPSQPPREFDLVLMGATGFTGQLVAEYLLETYGVGKSLNWAMAGRSEARLRRVREELGAAAADVPIITADSHDRASLDAMCARATVVLTTVGPYALHGSELVAACIANNTNYCDLCGEVPWMRRMLDQHAEAAESSGATFVHCCGFDSVPSDMGVLYLQDQATRKFGQPLQRIKYRLKAASGGMSGGTVASMLNIAAESKSDSETARILKDPYALAPQNSKPEIRQPYVSGAAFDDDLDSWVAPFVMAAINTRVVHRSHALLDYAWGRDFRYDEATLTGDGFSGRMKAYSMVAGLGAFALGASTGPTRKLMQKLFLPDPGEGPDAEQRETGYFKFLAWGETAEGQSMMGEISGKRDPGYGATSRMISEVAIALTDPDRVQVGGGFYTPATALGLPFVKTLENKAGMKFQILG